MRHPAIYWLDAPGHSYDIALPDRSVQPIDSLQIGDPAVPALGEILQRGDLDRRSRAVYALKLIGSPKAKAVLRSHAVRESDPTLRDIIRRATSK